MKTPATRRQVVAFALAAIALGGCGIAAPTHTEKPPVTTRPADLLNALASADADVAVCWLGNAGWLVRGDNGQLIAIDPDLLDAEPRIVPPPISAEALAPRLGAVFITHEHGDHFRDATARTLAAQSKCLFVVPASCAKKAAALGVPTERLIVAKPKQPLDVLGLRVQPIHAFHGHRHQTVHRTANTDDCGYLITLSGLTLLHPGDSILTQDHLALTGVDALFVSPTSHNMAVAPAARLIAALKPRWIFPQHFGTYRVTPDNDFWTVGQPDELRAALPPELRGAFHALSPGDIFPLRR